jgi:glycoside/pentoside/hexuronide:cation symporter, GPH family
MSPTLPRHSPLQPDANAKLSFGEKAGYGVGDLAANFIFQTMIMFQLVFYTDTFGIGAAAAGTLLGVVRLWDAIFDPIIGMLADRTSTRWGKFRPWILWTAVPFGLMGFLAFRTPDFSPGGKLIYAYATYALLMMVYSSNNVPYSALSGVMTANVAERTSISAYRFVFAMIAQLIIQSFALPMVHFFGHSDGPKGYQITMGIFSGVAVLLLLITFFSTEERIHPAENQRPSFYRDFLSLIGSAPWRSLFAVTVVLFVAIAMRGSVVLYYFKYCVGREELFSWFNAAGTVASILGIMGSKRLALRFGKRNAFLLGITLTAVFTALFYLVPTSAIVWMFATEIVRQLFFGITIPLLWAAMADVADFAEWKKARRATGIVFAAMVFGLKAGMGAGGAISSYVLALHGYTPNVPQLPRSLEGIRLAMSVLPACAFALCAACLLFYPINRDLEGRMSQDLVNRWA